MRAGANSTAAQQTLSAEAGSVLKHSLTLARRRGHAHVTPLHVAATLLSSRASLLRRACLRSQPHQPSHHPLQCRALELCFNVALNRLPATPGPLLHHAQPSLSNALVAALKRAQAHQRRGCIEQQQQQQQQPVIAVRVELEQLVLSILDDPSVSRVMREAGFSSTAVKNNLEESSNGSVVSSVFQCYSSSGGGIYSTPSSPPSSQRDDHQGMMNTGFWRSHLLSEQNPFLFSPQKIIPITADHGSGSCSLEEDVKVVMEVLMGKRKRNVVVVGDSLSVAEGVVAEVMAKVERRDNELHEGLKSAHVIRFQFSSVPLSFMKREEVEMNIADLKRKVDTFGSTGGGEVIIYTGDLKWTAVNDLEGREESSVAVYRPVDHLIDEIGKLVSWYCNGSRTRVWLMAAASYQTYMKCQMKQPPLDVHWNLQAVSVPSGGLGLSLNANTSGQDSRIDFPLNPSQDVDKRPYSVKGEQDVLKCCPESTSNYEKEAGFKSIQQKSFSLHSVNKDTENGSSQLPFWLKPHGMDTLMKDDLAELRRKYNKLCQSLHHSPNNSSSIISNQSYLGKSYNYSSSHPFWPNKNTIFADSETISFSNYPTVRPNQITNTLPRFRRQQSCHIDFSFSNGSSKYQSSEPNLDSLKGMDDKEVKITLALGNLTYTDCEKTAPDEDLCRMLQENMPWQSETIPLILEALNDSNVMDRDKFVLIKGNDLVGKRRLAVGIAQYMFGSSDLLYCMNMRSDTYAGAEKREMLEKALRDHEKLVVLVENVNCADQDFAKLLAEGYDSGKLETSHERDNGHAIFILTVDGDEKSEEKVDSIIHMKLVVNEPTLGPDTPNSDHKRKADYWDSPIQSRSQRKDEKEEVVSDNRKRAFMRQSSSNALDLNIKADEDEVKPGEFIITPISTDLFRFLEKIKNCFVLNSDSDREEGARQMFLNKFKRSFQEAVGGVRNISSFNVEEVVLEKVFQGSGLYLNCLFEQWLKEVFLKSLQKVDTGERGIVSIRVCLGGKVESSCPEDDGFMGTCLPKSIPVCLTG